MNDTGEGIAPEFLPYVFDRFRQADGTSTRNHMGLGLGLAIVKHVVEMHGGSVHAASAGLRAGRDVHRRASAGREPWTASRAARLRTACPATTARRAVLGMRVLIVEDDLETRDILAAILERGGFSYRVADARQRGPELLLDDWQPDVIVSDIGMPDMDGYEFVRQLRARPPAQGGLIPALALSAFARNEDRELALRSGYQAHIAEARGPGGPGQGHHDADGPRGPPRRPPHGGRRFEPYTGPSSRSPI